MKFRAAGSILVHVSRESALIPAVPRGALRSTRERMKSRLEQTTKAAGFNKLAANSIQSKF
jgi:hypothetical protein